MKRNESAILALKRANPSGAETNHISIPPVEDLFDVATNQIDFMSAQSFPASDPPSYSLPARQEDRKNAEGQIG